MNNLRTSQLNRKRWAGVPQLQRILWSLLGALFFASTIPLDAAEPSDARMEDERGAFFENYCIHCHGPEEQNGKLRLDTIPFDIATDIQTADLWQKILGALNSGEMPPEFEAQPSNEEKAAFLEELSEKMVTAREKLADSGGTAVMRRLNRREYENTLRDLLGATVDVGPLPSDGGAGSFDTVGTSLFFSSHQFEFYLNFARRALDETIVDPHQPLVSETTRIEVEQRANEKAAEFIEKFRDILARHEAWVAADGKRPASDFGFLDAPRAQRGKKLYGKNAPHYHAYASWPRIETGTYFGNIHSTIAAGFSDQHPAGDYRLRISIAATDGAPPRRRFIQFGRVVDVGGRTDFSVSDAYQVTGTMDQPQVIEIPVSVAKNGSREFSFREMRPDYEKGHWKKDLVVLDPVLWVDWIEIEGPLVNKWPPENYQRLFGGDNMSIEQKRMLLLQKRSALDTVLADARSVRRKVNAADNDKLDEYFQSIREIEQRLAKEEKWMGKPKPQAPLEEPEPGLEGYEEIKMMYDLMVAALQTDTSRVITYRQPITTLLKSLGTSITAHPMSHYNQGERMEVS